jgi:CRP/FNR family transcriptional regulator, cyclic AMP receptor protein
LTIGEVHKAAALLVAQCGGNANNPIHLKLTLTHEEIAEMIGTARETVSRLFSDFKKKQLLQVKGSTLIIRNKPALEKMVHS